MSEQHGECFDCGMEQTDEDGTFCYGCKAWICDDCTTNDVSGFDHEPSDHLLRSMCCEEKIFSGECEGCGGPAND